MPEIIYSSSPLTVQHIISMWSDDSLNLEPGFQRKSVWSESDRKKLIDSIVRGYPLPAIFLYKTREDGHLVYHVIDGKQRLESILRFCGLIRGGRFAASVQLPGSDDRQVLDWRQLNRLKQQDRITGYKLQIIEVEGDLSDVIDLFVRINSTGKALTSQEKRHARHYSHSAFLKAASRLAESLRPQLLGFKVMTEAQLQRMKHIELTCEVMLSVIRGDVINKKAALDSVMAAERINQKQLSAAVRRAGGAFRRVFRMFPEIASTRFSKLSDFYSLVFLIEQFEMENLILIDKRRNKLAWEILKAFSIGVDKLREQQRKLAIGTDTNELYRDYLPTVTEGTDRLDQRRKRQQILRGLLEPIFEKRDQNRGFSAEQRRVLWNTTADRKCEECATGLIWSDFTIDHIDPWSRGGVSELKNAALRCRPCNSAKGNRFLHAVKKKVGRRA